MGDIEIHVCPMTCCTVKIGDVDVIMLAQVPVAMSVHMMSRERLRSSPS